VQLDELFVLLSAVKTGEVHEAEALTRLARAPTGWELVSGHIF